MNIAQKIFVVGMVFMSVASLKPHDRDEAFWLMRAKNCDQYTIAQYQDVTLDDYRLKDENGKNIYQIALDKHKQTGSIPCARLALSLEVEMQRLRRKLEEEIKILDEVEKTFETPHR